MCEREREREREGQKVRWVFTRSLAESRGSLDRFRHRRAQERKCRRRVICGVKVRSQQAEQSS